MTPRLRVFAGPNGSGKSTLVEYFRKNATFHLYTVINPDEIKKALEIQGRFDLPFDISLQELKDFAEASKRPDKEKIARGGITIENNPKIAIRNRTSGRKQGLRIMERWRDKWPKGILTL